MVISVGNCTIDFFHCNKAVRIQVYFLYVLDLDSAMLNSEAPQILLRPGQSLSLQCNKMQPDDKNKKFDLKWYFNNQTEVL